MLEKFEKSIKRSYSEAKAFALSFDEFRSICYAQFKLFMFMVEDDEMMLNYGVNKAHDIVVAYVKKYYEEVHHD